MTGARSPGPIAVRRSQSDAEQSARCLAHKGRGCGTEMSDCGSCGDNAIQKNSRSRQMAHRQTLLLAYMPPVQKVESIRRKSTPNFKLCGPFCRDRLSTILICRCWFLLFCPTRSKPFRRRKLILNRKLNHLARKRAGKWQCCKRNCTSEVIQVIMAKGGARL